MFENFEFSIFGKRQMAVEQKELRVFSVFKEA